MLTSIVATDEGLQNPYTCYEAVRDGSPRWRSASGAIVLTSYEDCLEALRHPKLGRAEADMRCPAPSVATARSATATPRRCCC